MSKDPDQICSVSLKVTPRIEGHIKYPQKLEMDEYSKLIEPRECPGCGGPIEIVEDSVERYKCKNYLDKCYKYTLITKAKKVLRLTGLGDAGIMKLFNDPDFKFDKWI